MDHYGAATAGKDAAGVDDFLTRQAQHEFAPETEDEQFFVILRPRSPKASIPPKKELQRSSAIKE